ERYSEAELRKALSDSLVDRKIDAMKRILAAVSVGRDAHALFPDVVKNVSFQSPELKKLVYIYLVQYAENNRDLTLLAINSFQKDLSDRSQQVRASALRAMASIKVLEVIQVVMGAVTTAASDSSPYVRKTAAQCMTKVYGVDADQFLELRKLLLKLMNDPEVQVVGSAVMAFRQICVVQPPKPPAEAQCPWGHQLLAREVEKAAGDDGKTGATSDQARQQLELLHPLYKRLVQNMLLMDAWAQQSCIDILMRYSRLFFASPEKKAEESEEGTAAVSEDLKELLKNLKLLLLSSSKGVTLAAAIALCYLGPAEELSSVTMPLMRCLRQATPEATSTLLVALAPLIEAQRGVFRPLLREFFVQSFDSTEVKRLKLEVIENLVDETNVQLVLRELQVYVSWHSQPDFVARAVQSIAKVALTIASVADACLRGLVKMLDSKCEALSCEAVVSLRALLQRRHRSEDSGLGSVLPHLVTYLEDLAAPTARASVIWIIGHYQQEVARLVPDVVRRLAKTFSSERPEVKQQILVLALK
ncbi:AP3B2, partial [Symbiodinium sp. CCMP2456]